VIACRRYYERVGVGTVMSLEEYMRTSFHPDCDFVDGEALERSVGERRHSSTRRGRSYPGLTGV
jgi:hypothetical protein